MTDWTVAAITKLTAAGVKRVYAFGSVPKSPEYAYMVVSASRVITQAKGLAGGHGLVRWFLTTQSFGRTHADADILDHLAFTALQDQQLAASIACGPCDMQTSALTRDPDDTGVMGRTTVYAFTTTREIPA